MRAIQIIVILLIIGVSLPLTAVDRDELAQFSSYDFDQNKRYDFSIHDDVLSRAPAWRTNEEYPPLSPRKAEASAREQLEKLVKEPGRWSRSEIELHQIKGENWVYLVNFTGFHPSGVIDGPVPVIRLVVLMDGGTIDPKVSPYGKGISGVSFK